MPPRGGGTCRHVMCPSFSKGPPMTASRRPPLHLRGRRHLRRPQLSCAVLGSSTAARQRAAVSALDACGKYGSAPPSVRQRGGPWSNATLWQALETCLPSSPSWCRHLPSSWLAVSSWPAGSRSPRAFSSDQPNHGTTRCSRSTLTLSNEKPPCASCDPSLSSARNG